ncbi:outer membrane protein OmpA-like peptidoglycan-associated protein [Pelomonas saccharophila]|uniref:Outer membrane protein OmpA-like peptidoglycan-associated protein n=1 Tax=Roseateles saccharophilus TaxID=304 RepID=A0ABU1YPS7_ROSSA|nr:OmpA family protein [Roseateles saccharophilus]MDR7270867.1 outer membrane protein OmpA-like peptidoglycan-associated protein [Roseateles saccharophilus]
MTLHRAALTLLASFALVTTALADAPKADVSGSADHPVLKRFTGSVLAGYAQQDWEQRSFPDASGVSKTENDKFNRPVNLEGKATRLFYLGQLGKSPLEVFRNYQQALNAAGFKVTWQCESEAQGCVKAYFALDGYERAKGMRWAEGDVPGVGAEYRSSSWPLAMSISYDQARMLVGTLSSGGRTLNLLLFTSMAATEHTNRSATYIEIVEPKAMPTGQVTVDAKAIASGLQAEGRIALYGLFFDTGKTDIKPDSNAQLDQMVATLKAQPALKVLIVGHTDNVGSIDANLALSEGRAKAVVAALTQRGIAANRLQARGIANFAPVASNASEDGRGRNRRVEMVLQ